VDGSRPVRMAPSGATRVREYVRRIVGQLTELSTTTPDRLFACARSERLLSMSYKECPCLIYTVYLYRQTVDMLY
jgi:hypothetical protein